MSYRIGGLANVGPSSEHFCAIEIAITGEKVLTIDKVDFGRYQWLHR